MPNQPNHEKAILSIRIQRDVKRAAEIEARRLKVSLTDFVTASIIQSTAHVVLQPEDYRQIADEIERARRMQYRKNHARSKDSGAPGQNG